MIIDTHAHLTDEKYENIEEIINNFSADNLSAVFCVGYDLKSSQDSLALANKHNNIYAIIGFHPSDIRSMGEKELEWIEEHAKDKKVIGIGEIGLDYHFDDAPSKEEQKEGFVSQIRLADKVGLPIIIHERDAIDDVLNILKANKKYLNHGGIIHCFGHDYKSYKKFEKLGFLVSFGGVVTFKNAGVVPETATLVPLSNMVLETDCPYLAPVPFRGKLNQPKYVNMVAEKIASLKGISVKEVENQTTQNALNLFKKVSL